LLKKKREGAKKKEKTKIIIKNGKPPYLFILTQKRKRNIINDYLFHLIDCYMNPGNKITVLLSKLRDANPLVLIIMNNLILYITKIIYKIYLN
jgi:hypothetical protein